MNVSQNFAACVIARGFCAVAIGTICGIGGCSTGDSSQSSAPQKQSAIRVLDLEGNVADLWGDRNRIATVLVFTRSDCPISNRYAPEVQRLYERFRPHGVEFVLVYVDPRETAENIRRHLKEFNYPCNAVRDPEHTLAAHCGATITPEAAVFGQSRNLAYLGRVDDRFVDVGQPRSEPTTYDLRDAIESTIHGKPVVRPRTKAVGCLIADLKN